MSNVLVCHQPIFKLEFEWWAVTGSYTQMRSNICLMCSILIFHFHFLCTCSQHTSNSVRWKNETIFTVNELSNTWLFQCADAKECAACARDYAKSIKSHYLFSISLKFVDSFNWSVCILLEHLAHLLRKAFKSMGSNVVSNSCSKQWNNIGESTHWEETASICSNKVEKWICICNKESERGERKGEIMYHEMNRETNKRIHTHREREWWWVERYKGNITIWWPQQRQRINTHRKISRRHVYTEHMHWASVKELKHSLSVKWIPTGNI